MNRVLKKRGRYLGTRIGHKWWRRYTEEGFIARGNGEYWIQDGSLFFQQHASQQPISLPLCSLTEIKVCPSRRNTIGMPILKLVWEKDGRWLSSSFVLPGLGGDGSGLLATLRIDRLRA